MNLYVYYQVAPAHAQLLQDRVTSMQKALGARATLSRRPDVKDGMHTWMETYPAIAQDFEVRLNAAVLQSGLAEWIHGPRHAEYFVEIASCA
jgi:hypothetical protein